MQPISVTNASSRSVRVFADGGENVGGDDVCAEYENGLAVYDEIEFGFAVGCFSAIEINGTQSGSEVFGTDRFLVVVNRDGDVVKMLFPVSARLPDFRIFDVESHVVVYAENCSFMIENRVVAFAVHADRKA